MIRRTLLLLLLLAAGCAGPAWEPDSVQISDKALWDRGPRHAGVTLALVQSEIKKALRTYVASGSSPSLGTVTATSVLTANLDTATATTLLIGPTTATGTTVGKAAGGTTFTVQAAVTDFTVTDGTATGLAFKAPTFDASGAGALAIAPTTATSIDFGKPAGGVTYTFNGTTDATILNGVVAVADGSTTVPSVHGADTDTGLAFTTNQIYLLANGDRTARVTSDYLLLSAGKTLLFEGATGSAYMECDGAIAGLLKLGATDGASSGTLSLAALGARICATDVAPSDLLISSMDSLPTTAGAGANEVGADLVLAGGIGQHLFTVTNAADVGATITITVGSVSTGVAVTTANVFTEVAGAPGANEFNAITDVTTSAADLVRAINTAAIGVTASNVAGVVYLSPAATTFSLLLAETGSLGTVTNAADGQVLVPVGGAAAGSPGLSFHGLQTTGFRALTGYIVTDVNGVQIGHWNGNGIGLGAGKRLDLATTGSVAWDSDTYASSPASGTVAIGTTSGGTDGKLGVAEIYTGSGALTLAPASAGVVQQEPAGKAKIGYVATTAILDMSGAELTSGGTLIPADAYDVSVCVRNTSTITGTTAVSYSVGIEGDDLDAFGAGIVFTDENSTDMSDWTVTAPLPYSSAAREVRITPNAGTLDAGTIQIVCFYRIMTAQSED